jgi:hypothetical protein
MLAWFNERVNSNQSHCINNLLPLRSFDHGGDPEQQPRQLITMSCLFHRLRKASVCILPSDRRRWRTLSVSEAVHYTPNASENFATAGHPRNFSFTHRIPQKYFPAPSMTHSWLLPLSTIYLLFLLLIAFSSQQYPVPQQSLDLLLFSQPSAAPNTPALPLLSR